MARSSFLNYHVPPHPQILEIGQNAANPAGADDLTVPIDESALLAYFQNSIRIFLDERREREYEWLRADRAFKNETHDHKDMSEVFTYDSSDAISVGLPYAAIMTTTSAIVPNSPHFIVSPKTEGARDRSLLYRTLLNNVWNSDERQWLQEKAAIEGQKSGLIIGFVGFETDYDAWAEEMDEEERQQDLRAEMTSEEQLLEDMVNSQFQRELDQDFVSPPKLPRGESVGNWDETYTKLISKWDYVADPDAESLVIGPRWEGRKLRMRLIDIRENPRYRKDMTAQLKPNLSTRRGGQVYDRGDRVSRRRQRRSQYGEQSVPESHQIVELYEIYDYFDPEFKDQGGALITICLDQGMILERRANPYGRRPFVVEAWNDEHDEIMPQNDLKAWNDLWQSFEDLLLRYIRSLRKAPNNTLVCDEDAEINADQIEGLLENDEGGVAFLPLAGRPITQVVQELRTTQVSGEYINALGFLMNTIRIIEGLGPNQFGGAPLKSETSGTEAAEIGRFTRSRLQLKENAITRWMTKMARNWLSALFRFTAIEDITAMVDVELSDKIFNSSRVDFADDVEIDVRIAPGSMAADGPQNKIQKLMTALQVIQSDPTLAQKLNRDAIIDLLNEALSLNTGEKMFFDEEEEGFMNNVLSQMVAPQGRPGRAGAPGPAAAPAGPPGVPTG